MSRALPMAQPVVDAAVHGSYCPKMCTFACPVAAATGLDEAVPWSFHREVADLAEGRAGAAGAWDRLRHCNGCLACQGACTYEQDVPQQVLAARAALVEAGEVPADVNTALEHLWAGRTALGETPGPLPESVHGATCVVVVGLEDDEGSLGAIESIARRSRVDVAFVRGPGAAAPEYRALGRTDLATATEQALLATIGAVTTVVCTDPAQLVGLRSLMPRTNVVDVSTWILDLLEQGRLRRTAAPALGNVTWHDPSTLARAVGITAQPRQVLRLLGGIIVEPEGHGAKTVSAGPGLAMHVLAPEAVRLTAARRASQLAATGATVVTTGAAERRCLEEAGLELVDLVQLVAERTQGIGAPAAAPATVAPAPPAPPTGSEDAPEGTLTPETSAALPAATDQEDA